MKSFFKRIKPFLAPIIITLIVLILFHVVFMLGYVPSDSMEPTLEAGSLILGLRIHGELEKEDIIIFKHDGTCMIKRIATIEGDVIIHNGQTQTVSAGCLYVLGDNQLNSHDSRYRKEPYVKLEDIMAKLLLPLEN